MCISGIRIYIYIYVYYIRARNIYDRLAGEQTGRSRSLYRVISLSREASYRSAMAAVNLTNLQTLITPGKINEKLCVQTGP